MTEYNDDNLDPIVERLERERPVPRPAFRGALRRHLLGEPRTRQGMVPARPRLLVGAYAGSGTLLMAIAAIGLMGVGPLAA